MSCRARLPLALVFLIVLSACSAPASARVPTATPATAPVALQPAVPSAAPAPPATVAPTPAPAPLAMANTGTAPDYWPTNEWRSTTPEEQGVDSATLAKAFDAIEAQRLNFHSILIVRNGYLIAEAYFNPYQPETKHQLASVTKSIVGTIAGIALDRGDLKSVSQPLLDFYPEATVKNLTDQKRAITLAHLLSMSSGLDCQDMKGSDGAMRSSKDWAQFTVNLPMTTTPGTAFSYCSPSPHLVSAILTRATGKSARDLANKWLFDPLGIPYLAEGFWPSDPQGISDGCCGAYLTPRNMAKLGLLWLQGGQWAGRQIVSRGWIAAAGTGRVTWQPGRDYGYLFWVYPAQGYFSAMGTGGQHIHVIPAKNMVVVFTAGESFEGQDKMTALMDQYIIPAARSAAPLPANVQGLADLQARVRRAAEPKVKPGSLPEMAKKVSGVSYALKGSSAGWKTVVFKFEEGSDVAMVTLNGELGLMIGLDNVYRLTSLPGNTYAGLRGRWTDASTFVVDDITLGELEQTELKVAFAGDSLAMTVHEKVWGWTEEVSGK